MFIFYALRFWYKIVRSQRLQSKGFARQLESTQKEYIAFDNTDNYGRPLTNLSTCLSMNVAKSEMNASCCRAPSSWRMGYPQCNRSRCEWRRRPKRRNVSARSRSIMHCSMPARSAWYFYYNWYVQLPVFVHIHVILDRLLQPHPTVTLLWATQCHGLSLSVQIDLAITSLLPNQPAASEAEHARDQCQSAAVSPPANLSFRPCLASPNILFTLLWQRTNSQYSCISPVSAIAVFRLVDNIVPSCLQIVLWPNYKCKLCQNHHICMKE